ncbi:MAG TPA: tetratricopeptide repeat protein [Spirochaetia bacterium]|nr:tetratricopeptide repeat protein [Spirochaetia bacterium]
MKFRKSCVVAALAVCLLGGAAGVLAAAPAEDDLYAEAESRYLGKNYTAALESYDAFAAAYPLSERIADVQYRRAVCLYRLERYRDAVQLIGDIEVRYRTTRYFSFIPLWKGLSLYGLKSYSLCVDSLDAFLAGPPDPEFTPQALLHKALALQALSNDEAARQSLTALTTSWQASRLFPYAAVLLGSLEQKQAAWPDLLSFTQKTDPSSFPEPWKSNFLLLRADALWQSGRAEEAQPLYLQLVGAADDVALVAYGRLFAAAQRRQDLQGMRDLTQAAEARFSGRTAVLSELWTRIGAETFRLGDPNGAEPFLRRAWNARASAPVSEVVPIYLSDIMLGRKDPAGAKQILVDFLAAGQPGTGAAIIRLGDLALMASDFASAAGYYSRFRISFPDSRRAPEAGYLLAYCQYRQGMQDQAARLVSQLLTGDTDPTTRQQLLRLQIVLLTAAKRNAEAADALAAYAAKYPDDTGMRLDYMKDLFLLRRFSDVQREADALRQQSPSLDQKDPAAGVTVSYLRGLALITSRDYSAAATELASIPADAAQKAGLAVIVPYARYYLGWAYLRLSDFANAARVFDDFASAYPAHELAPMVMYLAGWSHYSRGEYDTAAADFSQVMGRKDQGELADKSRYLYAKSLLALKRFTEAAPVLLTIAGASPPTAWSPDALFDYASALADSGQPRPAADAFKRLVDTFPSSPLRDEASYRRAETYYLANMLTDARAAFDDYRTRFPQGKLVDAALYWSGKAAQSMGEDMAAALLWERLESGYPASSFRGPALQQTADAYAQAHQYQKALDLYTEFIKEYPDQARASRADIKAEQVRLLATGEGDREAALSAIISRETGDKKRQATIDLARLYIYSGDSRADAGYRMLLPVVKEGDPQGAPQAQVLIGEYFYRKGDLAEAARQFLGAAVIGGVAPATAASAIYRAAEMMQMAKRPDDVAALVHRLETTFPDSDWTVKARLLLGGAS